MTPEQSRRLGIAVTAAVLALLLVAGPSLTAVRTHTLCRPAVWGVSLVLGGTITSAEGGGYTLLTQRGPLTVSPACSAFHFFAVLVAILTGLTVQNRRYALLPIVAVGAYGVTIAANVTRIVCARYAQFTAQALLPPEMSTAVHMGMGLLCFAPFLLLTYIAAERIMIAHEKTPA